MTTEEPTGFDALCDAYEGASEATRDEFLQWLDSWRVSNAQQRQAANVVSLEVYRRRAWLEPLLWDDEPQNDPKVWEAHEEEANRLGAEFGNFGWSSGHYGDWFVITSKTSLGRFSTSRHAKTGEVEHFWHDVE